MYKYEVWAYDAGKPAKRRPMIQAKNLRAAKIEAKRIYKGKIVHVFPHY